MQTEQKNKRFSTDKAGFTLVEIAIVLVIIGVILGATLKGQEIIKNAKAKRLVNQQKEIIAAIMAYSDRYGYLPGDDAAKTAHGWTTSHDGGANGNVSDYSAACLSTDTTVESCLVWEHLRFANLISGTTNPQAPNNVFGGTVGFGSTNVYGEAGLWSVFTAVPYDIAAMVDLQYDDGVYNTGSIRGSAAYVAGNPINLFFKY